MKKGYQSPKAEKITFQYSESVVASSGKCEGGVTIEYREIINGCRDREEQVLNPWGGDSIG